MTQKSKLARILVPLILMLFTGIALTAAPDDHRDSVDPFCDLDEPRKFKPSKPKAEPTPIERPPGLRGLLLAETSLMGIVTSGQSSLAILRGIDQSTYIARAGARLLDGYVTAISRPGLLFKYKSQGSDQSSTIFIPCRTENQQ